MACVQRLSVLAGQTAAQRSLRTTLSSYKAVKCSFRVLSLPLWHAALSQHHTGLMHGVCQRLLASMCFLFCHAAVTQHHVQVSGIGKYPFLALERADLQFGNVLVGEQVEQSVQLSNQGLLPADFTVIQAQPPSGSLADSSVKISPIRSGIRPWHAMSVHWCCQRHGIEHQHMLHLVPIDHQALVC